MWNSMVMFTYSVLGWKYLFWANLVQKWKLGRPGWMPTWDELRRSIELARLSTTSQHGKMSQLTSCYSEEISTGVTNDCWIGFKRIQNSVPSYKRASTPHIITPLKSLENLTINDASGSNTDDLTTLTTACAISLFWLGTVKPSLYLLLSSYYW